ncbi:MAG: septal ring lytic transglycosylase RlpA family protein [Deltaproteobacteria bacterium]|nr:septal ring lytic transglycosylase RlpA family protein [Deltaproteobacteria bacterium]
MFASVPPVPPAAPRLGRAALLVLLAAAGCSVARHEAPPPGPVQVGIASWYSGGFRGSATSSGERFERDEFTAAHPSLPLGTRARVTNLANDRSVVVRINDRGPFVHGRVLDLSYGAARALGIVRCGTARVRIEVLGWTPIPATTTRARFRDGRRHRQSHRRRQDPSDH